MVLADVFVENIVFYICASVVLIVFAICYTVLIAADKIEPPSWLPQKKEEDADH